MSWRKRVRNVGTWFSSAINRVTVISGVAAGVILALTASIMVYEVFMRYVVNEPTIWVFEISHYLLAAVMTWGLAYGLKTRAHITVEVIRQRLPCKWRRWLNAVTSLLTVCMVVYLVWATNLLRIGFLERGEASWTLLRVPKHWPATAPLIGFLIFALMALVVCWENWQKARSGGGKDNKTMTEY